MHLRVEINSTLKQNPKPFLIADLTLLTRSPPMNQANTTLDGVYASLG